MSQRCGSGNAFSLGIASRLVPKKFVLLFSDFISTESSITGRVDPAEEAQYKTYTTTSYIAHSIISSFV